MESILIHPKSKEQLAAVKAFAKALNMNFETKVAKSPYNPDFVKKILKGREDVKRGKGVKIPVSDLWK
ncbi:MAG: hypothetical protein KF845_10065 [Cyclobacteriaceae bacterium]|nr:hypothetical protein [Cyclobacteriaceae bacterium]